MRENLLRSYCVPQCFCLRFTSKKNANLTADFCVCVYTYKYNYTYVDMSLEIESLRKQGDELEPFMGTSI